MTTNSDRKKELKRAYRERPKTAGVFQIKNTVSGKLYLGSSLNLDGTLNRHRFMLANGSHFNRALQEDWKQAGPDAFVLEILETVDVRDEPGFDLEGELGLLEEIWLEKLRPVEPRGYNTGTRIREV